MKKCVVMGLMICSLVMSAEATVVEIESHPADGTDRDAYCSPISNGVYGIYYTGLLTTGCPTSTLYGYRVVTKFPLDSVAGAVTSATLNFRMNYVTNGTQYLGIQHFTVNRPDVFGDQDGRTTPTTWSADGALTKSDFYSTAVETVEVIPVTQLSTEHVDVTALVQADKAAGFDFSTFRFYLANADGSELIAGTTQAAIYTQDQSGEEGQGPKLDVTFVPEPATLGMLAFASMFAGLRRRK